jgi:hypothetical protein
VLDAHYFRTQAALYFELSRQMSLRGDAEYCRVHAERHLAMAAEREGEGENANSSSSPQASSPAQASEGWDHAAVFLPRGL